ncbi:cupin domain-containing protein [Thermophagus sp. OGC60D27]|uniref:cupin domain-containing protein n=1 Tax=Thermophagus sp. OGC60D27 TaxID=3458415 RepID=UPI0040383A57
MFFKQSDVSSETVGKGVTRRILGYDSEIMMVQVDFEKGSIGDPHRHPHRQTSYVVSGIFEVTIGEETQRLKAGDSFFVEPDHLHGVVCLEKGTLIDVFNPSREDFL